MVGKFFNRTLLSCNSSVNFLSDSSDDERAKRDQIGQIFADDDLFTKDFETEKLNLRKSKETKVNSKLPGEQGRYFKKI